jgi:hypothetical protein
MGSTLSLLSDYQAFSRQGDSRLGAIDPFVFPQDRL